MIHRYEWRWPSVCTAIASNVVCDDQPFWKSMVLILSLTLPASPFLERTSEVLYLVHHALLHA